LLTARSKTQRERLAAPDRAQPLDPRVILQRAALAPQSLRPADILRLQQTIGNQAVARLLSQLSPARSLVQAKLTVNAPGDEYEQEADRIAEEVMATPAVQRAELEGGAEKEDVDEKPEVMTKPQPSPAAGAAFEADDEFERQVQAARGQGQPLPPALREEFETKFGADFGGVRIHTGTQPDQLARSVQARAFTSGRDIFFVRQEYQPGRRDGRGLIAHELAHVLQQTGAAHPAGAPHPASTPAVPPVNGAGIIQRAKIGDLDTENPDDLLELKKQVAAMKTIKEIGNMRSQLPARNRSNKESELYLALDTQKKALSAAASSQEPTQAPSAEPSSVTATEPTGATSESSGLTAEKSQQSSQSSLIDARKTEAKEPGEVIKKYVDLYVVPRGEVAPEQAQVLPRWILGQAITQLEGQADKWTVKLLDYLQERCSKPKNRDRAIIVTILFADQHSVSGELNSRVKVEADKTVGFKIYLPLKLQDPEIRLNDADRKYYITYTARTFIHETAHLWQLEHYRNYSYPWSAEKPTQTVEREKWPEEMQEAYSEFEELGEKKSEKLRELKLREQWSEFVGALEHKEYFNLKVGTDWRAREFVSHLIELVHLWGWKTFSELLPLCATLLDTVLIEKLNVE
jgi:hypothetical protein